MQKSGKDAKSKGSKQEFLAVITACSVVVLLVCLPSCAPRQQVIMHTQVVVEKKHAHDQLDVLEAKWSDAPLPLDAKRDLIEAKESTDALSCVFAYTTDLSNAECLDFYRCQMERLGWQEGILFSFVPHEMVIVYEKPSRRAVVTIRPSAQTSGQTSVCLYVGIKQQGHDIRALVDQAEKIKN